MIPIRNDEPQKGVHMGMCLFIGKKLFKNAKGKVFALDKDERIPRGLIKLSRKEINKALKTTEEESIHATTGELARAYAK